MPRKRVSREVIALLESLLDMARDGTVTQLFAVYGDQEYQFNHTLSSHDPGDLLLQVRTEVIRAQVDVVRDESKPYH